MAAAAAGAVLATPDAVELLHGGFDEAGIIGEDACLEVTAVTAFHADAGSGKVGGADVGGLKVEDEYFEVDSRAEHLLQRRLQYRVTVKVFSECRPRLFGMDETYLHAMLQKIGKDPEKRFCAVAGFTWRSLMSAVPIQSDFFTEAALSITFS